MGRVGIRTETRAGQPPRRWCYEYDQAGRLVRVRDGYDAGVAGCLGGVVEEYRYDANGNRIYARNTAGIVDGDTGTEVLVDAQDRLLEYGSLQMTYTAAGELDVVTDTATNEVTDYDYDALGNLTRVTLPDGRVVEYVVDARGRRVGKKVDGVLVQGFLYGDGLRVVAELDGSGAVVARFVYGTGRHVPDYMVKDGSTYRLVTDHLGSVLAVVDVATGTVVQELTYDAWGRTLTDTNPGFQPFGFAGGLADADTGLVHFGAREYWPKVGRWTSKDPLRFAAGDPNLYGYVLADPVNLLDPRGRAPKCEDYAGPGEYCSVDDAVQAFCDLYGPDTMYGGGPEYCTAVYESQYCFGGGGLLGGPPEPDACYSTYGLELPPLEGTTHTCFGMWPDSVATCHTHPNRNGPSSEDASACGGKQCYICEGDDVVAL